MNTRCIVLCILLVLWAQIMKSLESAVMLTQLLITVWTIPDASDTQTLLTHVNTISTRTWASRCYMGSGPRLSRAKSSNALHSNSIEQLDLIGPFQQTARGTNGQFVC
eukprot:1148914_1